MKKYRLLRGRLKNSAKNFPKWKIEIMRAVWREKWQKRSERKHGVMLFGDEMTMFPDTSPDVSDIAVANVSRYELQHALSVLDAAERYIIFSYYFEQKSDREIGLAIGCSQQRANEFRHLTLYKLKKLLQKTN